MGAIMSTLREVNDVIDSSDQTLVLVLKLLVNVMKLLEGLMATAAQLEEMTQLLTLPVSGV